MSSSWIPADLSWPAVARGSAVGAAVSLPAGIVARIVGESSPISLVMLGVIVVGLGVGGAVAARAEPGLALAHGALAGLGAYLGVQAVGVITTLARGEGLNPAAYPVFALISTSCGLLGGFLAAQRVAGTPPREGPS